MLVVKGSKVFMLVKLSYISQLKCFLLFSDCKMLGAYIARSTVAVCTGKTLLNRTTFLTKPNAIAKVVARQAAHDTRSNLRRATRRRSLKEIVMAPAGEKGISRYLN